MKFLLFSNFDLSVSLLLTFLVISDKKSYKRNAAKDGGGFATLNISPSLETPPLSAKPTDLGRLLTST